MTIEARTNVIALDIAFLLHNLGKANLESGGGTSHIAPTGENGVANACEEISNWISHGIYQLDLMTPGMSPRRESNRKQIRHSSNFR
jgi:hypothetical protein